MKKPVNYIPQQAEQLRLNLIRGAVPKDQVQILSSECLVTQRGSLYGSIIGASHFFEWVNLQGNTVLAEVFACQQIEVPEVLFYGSLAASQHHQQVIDDIGYHFQAQQLSWDENIINNFHQQRAEATPDNHFNLSYQFPVSSQQKQQGMQTDSAITLLSVQLLPAQPLPAQQFGLEVRIDSLHAYPQEKQLVITKSIISSA